MGLLRRLMQRIKIKPIGLLLIAFVLLGLYYSVVTPLFEGPDETGHYAFVAYLMHGNGLPIQNFDAKQNAIYEGHQPPIYYALTALLNSGIDLSNASKIIRPNPRFIWGGQGSELNAMLHTAAEQFPYKGVSLAMHLARALSVLFGAMTVWGTYQLGKLITIHEIVALGAASLVAFNPQFLFISSLINNDNALIAFSTLALLMMTRLLVKGNERSRSKWLGVWLGMALLSKMNALVLGLPVFFVIVLLAFRARSWKLGGVLIVQVGLPVILISGWWFVRNQILYGDPFGYRLFLSSVSTLYMPENFGQWESWRSFFEITHQSFWGDFGWMVIQLRPVLSSAFVALYPISVVGGLIGVAWRNQKESSSHPQINTRWLLLGLMVLVFVLWTVNFARTNGGSAYQGRYLFPSIAAVAVLLISGLSAVVPDRLRWLPIGLAIVPLSVLAILVPSQYIAPAYRYFTLTESALLSISHHTDGTFSSEIALAGYDFSTAENSIHLTLYWHAQSTPLKDYKVFVHAINSNGQLCGQQDALTQAGTFPMTAWRAGDVIEDGHDILVDANCWRGNNHHLEIGLYLEDTGDRLLYSINGIPVSDYVNIPLSLQG